MSSYSVGIHIICTKETSLSCVVIKSGAIIKEEPRGTEELQRVLKTYEPDVILVTYLYGKDSLAVINKLLNHVNYIKSSVKVVLNPIYDVKLKNYSSINTRFIQLIRNNNDLEDYRKKDIALNSSIQILSHEVLANLVTIAEHAKVMISKESPESQQCEMFIGRLRLVQSRIQEVVSELESANLNLEATK